MDLVGHHDWLGGALDHGPERVLHGVLERGPLRHLLVLARLTRRVRRVVAGKVLAAVAAACF